MDNDLLFRLSLTKVPNIGYVHAKTLAQAYPSAQAIFTARRSELEKIEGIGEVRAKSIKQFSGFKEVEKEMRFLEKFQIQAIYLRDKHYPQRLLNCFDPPTLLFYKGAVDLNASRIISIVGTRHNSDYGRKLTEQIVEELATYSVIVVSGLAFGIDAVAHKACIRMKVPTIGVLAHGLHTIYPPAHAPVAKEMLATGGLLTEFQSGVPPDKHNFPCRNRVVAGISDATIIIETGLRGGSMITAELACGYNRDVFALPGRTTDAKSAGCNHLIASNKAIMITSPSDLAETLGWNESKLKKKKQKELFINLTKEESVIADLLKEQDSISIDELNLRSGLSSSVVAAALLTLELEGVVEALPGKRYRWG